MTKEVWRFIDSGNCSPSYNMALDEALLDWHSEGKIPPDYPFLWLESGDTFNRLLSKSRKRDQYGCCERTWAWDLSEVRQEEEGFFMNMNLHIV